MSINTTERNITLDYFKIILCILVINIHTPFVSIYPPQSHDFLTQLGYISGWLFSHGIARIAVPLFFILNGYFLDLTNRAKLVKYIKRLIIMYIVWTLFYLPTFFPYLDVSTFIRVLISGYFHLWYLPSLIGAIILLYITNLVIKNKTILITIAVLLFILGYLVQMRDPYTDIEMIKYRNFLFFGFPFVLFGYLIKNSDIVRYKKTIITFLIIGFILLLSESYLYMIQQKTNNLMLSLLIICPVIFTFVLQNSKIGVDRSNGIIGQLSTAVFYIHPMVIRWSALLFAINVISFPYIVITSFIAGILIIQINKYFKIFL